MKIIISMFFAACFVFTQLHAKIIESPTLQQFEEVISTLDADALVLLDVDETLVVPKDCILKSGANNYWNQYTQEAQQGFRFHFRNLRNIGDKDYWTGQLWSKMEYEAVNPKIADSIAYLQSKHIRTIAFTACPIGACSIVASIEDWRIRHLKKNQFDFSSAFPEFPKLELKIQGDPLSRFYDLQRFALFKEGVLFCNGNHKGPALSAFLAAIKWKPSKIVFLDDRLDFLQSVEKALQKEGIEFIGLHYTEASSLPCVVNEAVAKFQVSHFYQTGEWLNEQAAEEQLQR